MLYRIWTMSRSPCARYSRTCAEETFAAPIPRMRPLLLSRMRHSTVWEIGVLNGSTAGQCVM